MYWSEKLISISSLNMNSKEGIINHTIKYTTNFLIHSSWKLLLSLSLVFFFLQILKYNKYNEQKKTWKCSSNWLIIFLFYYIFIFFSAEMFKWFIAFYASSFCLCSNFFFYLLFNSSNTFICVFKNKKTLFSICKIIFIFFLLLSRIIKHL